MFDLELSALAYVNLVYTYGEPDDVYKQALTALYNYALAAEAYAAED